MDAAVAHQIWNYIGMLGVDRETARDLYQEAETAIWDASAHRATSTNHSYLVKTGIGAIRHWLRDRLALIRIPGYLHDRGQAAEHMKTILPLDDMTELIGQRFEDDLLEQLTLTSKRSEVIRLLPLLANAERQVIESILAGQSIREIAKRRRVRVACVYAQRSKAINKLRRLVAPQQNGLQPDMPATGGETRKEDQMAQASRRFLEELQQVARQYAEASSTQGSSVVIEDRLLCVWLAQVGSHKETTIGILLTRLVDQENSDIITLDDDHYTIDLEALKQALDESVPEDAKKDGNIDPIPADILAQAGVAPEERGSARQESPSPPLAPPVVPAREKEDRRMPGTKRSTADILAAIRAIVDHLAKPGEQTVTMQNLPAAIASHLGLKHRGAGASLLAAKVRNVFPRVVTMTGIKKQAIYTINLGELAAAEKTAASTGGGPPTPARGARRSAPRRGPTRRQRAPAAEPAPTMLDLVARLIEFDQEDLARGVVAQVAANGQALGEAQEVIIFTGELFVQGKPELALAIMAASPATFTSK